MLHPCLPLRPDTVVFSHCGVHLHELTHFRYGGSLASSGLRVALYDHTGQINEFEAPALSYEAFDNINQWVDYKYVTTLPITTKRYRGTNLYSYLCVPIY